MHGSAATIPRVVIVNDNDAIRRQILRQGPERHQRRIVPISVKSQNRDWRRRPKTRQGPVEPSLHHSIPWRAGQLHRAFGKVDWRAAVFEISRPVGIFMPIYCAFAVFGSWSRKTFEAIEQKVIS